LEEDLMTVAQERLRILKMIEAGTLTAGDGATLLIAMDGQAGSELGEAASHARWMRIREAATANPGALPVFKAMQVTGKLVIDGTVSAMEWTPGDATGVAPEIHDTAELIWTARGQKATRPCQALIQTDDTHLYVRFDNSTNPEKGVTGGHRWGT